MLVNISRLSIFIIAVLSSSPKLETGSSNIITRTEWNARPQKAALPLTVPVPYVIIHHSIMAACLTLTSCKESVQKIQNFHMDVNGWDDIGYNVLIGGDGNVYEGRGWEQIGAHAKSYNSKSIGICLIGNFNQSLPTSSQMDSAKAVIKFGVDEGFVSEEYQLLGHREVRPTKCPGEALFQEILTWPHKVTLQSEL